MQPTTQAVAADARQPANQLRTRPLSPALGAEILNMDLSQPMTDALFESIRDCWHDNIVVLFRDQHLSEADQVRFAERFGSLALSHTRRYTTDNPAVMLISNIRQNGKQIGALPDGEMQFHSDQCYQEKPAMASMLYAIEIPGAGGDTLFANAYKAYETLPNDIKRRLDGFGDLDGVGAELRGHVDDDARLALDGGAANRGLGRFDHVGDVAERHARRPVAQ